MCSLGVSDTGSPAAVIPGRDVSYLTSPQHTHLCINFPETTGADRTEPHTRNVRSIQGLSGQRKDRDQLAGGGGLEVCTKQKETF